MDRTTDELIERCQAAVVAHPQHDLRLGLRQRVWVALGPRQHGADVSIGRVRRIALAHEAATKVLPIWTKAVPDDRMPEAVLRAADRFCSQTIAMRDAWEERNLYWQYFVEKSCADERLQIACAVGFAAVQTLTVVLEDEKFDPASMNESLTDQEIDADDLDAAFFSAAAFAGGPVWVPESNALLRYDFWMWWLGAAAHLMDEKASPTLS